MFPFPVNVEYFIYETLPLQLTLDNLYHFEKGKMYKFLCLNPNLDVNYMKGKSYEVKPAEEMFKENTYIEYIHDEGTKGLVRFSPFKGEFRPFEWYVEYFENRWSPLRDGYVKPERRDGKIVRNIAKEALVNLSRDELNEYFNTGLKYSVENNVKKCAFKDEQVVRIGWNGPVIPVELLKYCPKCYFVKKTKQDNLNKILCDAKKEYLGIE
jgi:hypothetical protein